MLDRIKGAWVALARGAQPTIDYQAMYRAKVLKQHPNRRRLDLAPEDARLPVQMPNVPLKVGLPGLEVHLLVGHFVLVGWENGRPNRPYATLWDSGALGTTPVKLILNAGTIELGGVTVPLMDGVLTGQSVDPFTGMQHWMLGNSSVRVGAKKV